MIIALHVITLVPFMLMANCLTVLGSIWYGEAFIPAELRIHNGAVNSAEVSIHNDSLNCFKENEFLQKLAFTMIL